MFDYAVAIGFLSRLIGILLAAACFCWMRRLGLDACVCYITSMIPEFWKCMHVLILTSFCKISLSPLKAYRAAMQTQWSWILQLCHCVEQHLRENAAYFEVRM